MSERFFVNLCDNSKLNNRQQMNQIHIDRKWQKYKKEPKIKIKKTVCLIITDVFTIHQIINFFTWFTLSKKFRNTFNQIFSFQESSI